HPRDHASAGGAKILATGGKPVFGRLVGSCPGRDPGCGRRSAVWRARPGVPVRGDQSALARGPTQSGQVRAVLVTSISAATISLHHKPTASPSLRGSAPPASLPVAGSLVMPLAWPAYSCHSGQ